MSEKFLTVDQVAAEMHVHPETVRDWLRAGRLRGQLLSRRAGWRVAESEVNRALTEGLLPATKGKEGAAAATV